VQPEKGWSSEWRRLAAGDWAAVTGTTTTFPGLGKIVDGEYDPADDALVLARLEFARGTRPFFPGDLRRVDPDEEASVCEAALARGLLSAEEAGRLRPALVAFRLGEVRFVRSPGLLDRLWAFLPPGPERGASPRGLVALFDDWSGPAPAPPPPPAPLPTSAPLPTPAPLTRAIEPPRPVERRPEKHAPAPPNAVLDRVLGTLNHGVLGAIAQATGISLPAGRFTLVKEMRAALVAARVPLPPVLLALTTNQLRAAYRELRLPAGEALDYVGDDALRKLILRAAGAGNDGDREPLGLDP
jgi:hypothetical protein